MGHELIPGPMTSVLWPGARGGQGYTNKQKTWRLGVGSLSPKSQGLLREERWGVRG